MAWVVDTCLLIDIAEDDPVFGRASAEFVGLRQGAGLVVCPITFVELAPVFAGDAAAIIDFLQTVGIAWPQSWTPADTERAFAGWARYVALKRQGLARKRPIADILIGAFSERFEGLLTRNPNDFEPFFPGLTLAAPRLLP